MKFLGDKADPAAGGPVVRDDVAAIGQDLS